MGESTSRWAGMAPPRRHWSTTTCWGQITLASSTQHGAAWPGTTPHRRRQVPKSEPSLQLANVVPATWSLQPRRETDANQTTSLKKIRGQLLHEGEVGEAIRTCDLGFSQEAGVGSALCGRSRCVKGPGRASVWRAEHQGKAQGRPSGRS